MKPLWTGVATVVVAIALAVAIVLAILYTVPVGTPETVSFALTSDSSQPYLEFYCLPESTVFSFAWHTSDGSSVTVTIWSPGELIPYQYAHYGASGNGSLFSVPVEEFGAANVTASSVVVFVSLSFSVNETAIHHGPPSYGPCSWTM